MKEAPVIEYFRNNLTALLGKSVKPSLIFPGTYGNIRIAKKTIRVKEKVGISDGELVLFYSDYGFIIKKYNLILTDAGVYYINYGTIQDMGKWKSFLWKDVIDIWIEKNAFHCSTPKGKHVIQWFCFNPLLSTDEKEVLINKLKQLVVVAQRECGVMPKSTKKTLYKNT